MALSDEKFPILAFTCATPDYFPYAEALQKSFFKHNPHDQFYLHRITNYFQDDEQKVGYAANIRCVIANKFLTQGFTNLLYMDADSIVRGSLSELKTISPDSDILALPRPYMPKEEHKFLISTLFFRNCDHTTSFVRHWVKNTYRRKLDLMTVQPAFYETTLKSKNCKIGDLPVSYTDWEMENESLIWCAKGPKKQTDSKYLAEMATYATNK